MSVNARAMQWLLREAGFDGKPSGADGQRDAEKRRAKGRTGSSKLLVVDIIGTDNVLPILGLQCAKIKKSLCNRVVLRRRRER